MSNWTAEVVSKKFLEQLVRSAKINQAAVGAVRKKSEEQNKTRVAKRLTKAGTRPAKRA